MAADKKKKGEASPQGKPPKGKAKDKGKAAVGERPPLPTKGKGKAKDKGKAAIGERPPLPKDYEPRLRKEYRERIAPAMKEKFAYKSAMQIPKITKIVLNIGAGDASQNPKLLDSVIADLGVIAGQKPMTARARKSISNFKLREGMPIGAFVTLRNVQMYEFLDRLLAIAIPRIRDFRGVSDRSFDGRGNYTLGIKEQIVFPEIDYDKIDKIRGMDITLVTSAQTDEEAFELLKQFGLQFQKRETAAEAAA
jgi:large subunit ribosomal protein L5